jgi:hypothetical protein
MRAGFGWPASQEMNMQVEVEILVQTITAQYGVLSQGDILRTSPEFAKHLVDDCGAAKYKKAPTTAAPPPAPVSAAVASPVSKPEAPVVTTAKPASTPKADKPKNA